MRAKILSCVVAATLALAACGSDDDDSASDDETTTEPTTEAEGSATTEAAAGDALVGTGDTELGEVLTDQEGLTLYGFTPDSGGVPTCEGECAAAWPPLTVEGAELPEGLDAEVFSVVERPDGTFQLAAGEWPLYTYAADAAPGDVTGQGLGDSWYVVDGEGQLVRDAAAGATTTAG